MNARGYGKPQLAVHIEPIPETISHEIRILPYRQKVATVPD